MRRRRGPWLAACVLLGCLTSAGCAPTEATPTEGAGPAKVVPIKGTDRSRVILTAKAAQRVGIVTEPVRVIGVGTGSQSVVPLAAVLWDKNGRTWAYTSPAPLTFVPRELVISRVEGDTAILRSGPPPGTPVVTVGGAELLGAEYGVSGE